MALTDARMRANKKYDAKTYDNVYFRVRKEVSPTREEIQAHADKCGESLNAYILGAIKRRMEK